MKLAIDKCVKSLQVVFVQACQGARKPGQGVISDKRYHPSMADGPSPANSNLSVAVQETSVSPPPPALVESREVLHWSYGFHINFRRPNTLVVMATTEYSWAHRGVFFKHLAQELEYSDGISTINSMVQQCSKTMSLDEDEESRRQSPVMYDRLRQPLILPRAKAFDDKQLQDPRNQSGTSTIMVCLFYAEN